MVYSRRAYPYRGFHLYMDKLMHDYERHAQHAYTVCTRVCQQTALSVRMRRDLHHALASNDVLGPFNDTVHTDCRACNARDKENSFIVSTE